MKPLIFLLALAFAGPSFSQSKLFIYKYEGVILTGLPEKGLNKAGFRITSRVRIRGLGVRQYLLQLESPQLQELNGIWPKDPFTSLHKLTEKWIPYLTKPVKFEYVNGRVGTIFTSENLPEDILNILRGILNIFQITVKKSQNFYDLQEAGIEGICHARYIIQEDKRKDRLVVTKAKDFTNCQERVLRQAGTTYTQLCPSCQQRARNIRASAAFTIVLKPTMLGAIIQEARVREVHQFTPFHELDGITRLEARQSLILESVTTPYMETTPELISQRSLQYDSERDVLQQPFWLFKSQSSLIAQIKDTLNHMAQYNLQEVHNDAPERLLQLIQLFRSVSYKEFSDIWIWVKHQAEQRHWFLEALPAVGTIETMKCLKSLIQETEILHSEMFQALILAMYQVKTNREVLKVTKEIIGLDQVRRHQFARKLALLAYGSMIFRHCAEKPVCPDDVLKPIHNLLIDASSRPNDEDVILGLKVIGNAGQSDSIKNIIKLLPGFGTMASRISLNVRLTAIMALRNIARKDSRSVQRITAQIFLNRKNHPEERMIACAVLFATKPPLTLVVAVAGSLTTETSLQVASFTYSYIRAVTRSSLPSFSSLAAACNLAMNTISPKLEQLGHRFSKVYRGDIFVYKLMAGGSAKALLFKTSGSIIPTALLAKLRGHALGSSSDLIEVGFRAEGLQEVLMSGRAPDLRKFDSRPIRRIVNKLLNWKELPEEKPLASAYIKLFGQEIAFAQVTKEDLDEIKQKIPSLIIKYTNKLKEGVSLNPSKALVLAEIRRVVPTVIGLPMELSFTSAAIALSSVKIDAHSEPPIDKISRLLTSRIQLNAHLSPSVSVHTRVFMGINMPQIQSGVLLQANARSVIPVTITAKINLKERNIRIDSSPAERENWILSITSQVYAISRSTDSLSAEKVTPILPSTPGRTISSQRFRSSARSSRATSARTAVHLSPETLSDQVPCSEDEQSPFLPNRLSYRTCAATTTFGFKACVDARMENALPFKHIPLYRLIGEHTLNLSIAPVNSDSEIEKIVLEIQAGSRASSKLIRLTDKQLGPDKAHSSSNRLRLMKTGSQPQTQNSTWSSSSSSSSGSSSSRAQSRRSLTTRKSSLPISSSKYKQKKGSLQALPSKTKIKKRNWRSWSRSSSSNKSSSSSSSISSSRRSQLSKSKLGSGIVRGSKSQSLQFLELAFKPFQESQYTTKRKSVRTSSGWSRLTGKRRSSGLTSSRSSRSSSILGSSRVSRSSSILGSRRASRSSSSLRSSRSGRSSSILGSRRASRSSSSLRSSEQRYLISKVGPPSLVVLLRSRRTNGTQQGYQLTGYVKVKSDLPRVHLRLVELDETSNWKICADAAVPSSHKVLTSARWGENCDKYKVSVKVSNGQLASHPAVKLKTQWWKIPESLKYKAKVVGDYIPGLAYSFGFSQTYKRNPRHQITALVALTTPHTIDTIVRLPKMTAYYQGWQIPTTLPLRAISTRVQQKGFSSINEIPDLLLSINQRQCTAEFAIVKSFDEVELKYSLPNRCWYVLTQDCSESPKFILMFRRAEADQKKKEIKLVLAVSNTSIEAIPIPSGIKLLVNGAERDLREQIPQLRGVVTIQQKDTGICLEAPSINIDQLYFDGVKVEVVLDQMMSKTCGICGINNGEKKLMTPNQEEAKDVEGLFESWTYPGQSCTDDCKVIQEFVQLEKVIEFEGLESRCYSVEPVQKCLENCSPIETRSQIVNFHCVSSNFTVPDTTMFYKKSADLLHAVDSHSDCTCMCTEV
ncbi:vitellogenin-like [Cetorhinus maximus]